VPEALVAAHAGLGTLLVPPAPLTLPGFVRTQHQSEFLLRILFSCLVDADFLDTEAHFNPTQTVARAPDTIDVDLWQTLSVAQEARIAAATPTPVNTARPSTRLVCLKRGASPSRPRIATLPS
jgi:CRISPR-associated endonuclease/helicase Cas3